MRHRAHWRRKPRSVRFMSLVIFIGILVVAAISATLPDIPTVDNVDTDKLWQAAHERAVREGE